MRPLLLAAFAAALLTVMLHLTPASAAILAPSSAHNAATSSTHVVPVWGDRYGYGGQGYDGDYNGYYRRPYYDGSHGHRGYNGNGYGGYRGSRYGHGGYGYRRYCPPRYRRYGYY